MKSIIPENDYNRFVLDTAYWAQKGVFPWKWELKPPYWTITKASAQVYPEPNTSARPLGLLGTHQPVVILARQNDWASIGKNRWILMNHLQGPFKVLQLMPIPTGPLFEILWVEEGTTGYNSFERELRSRRLNKEVRVTRADSIENALSRLTEESFSAIISRRSSQQDTWMGINLCYLVQIAGGGMPVVVYTQERTYPELHTELLEAGGEGIIAGMKALLEWVVLQMTNNVMT